MNINKLPTTNEKVNLLGVVLLLVVILIIGLSIWLTFKRYQLIGKSIKNKQTGVALALASPEIFQGVSMLFRR